MTSSRKVAIPSQEALALYVPLLFQREGLGEGVEAGTHFAPSPSPSPPRGRGT